MLSRTADHLYWMSRYIERAESVARLVDAHYRMSLAAALGRNPGRFAGRDHEGAAHGRGVPAEARKHRAARRVRIRHAWIAISPAASSAACARARERPRGARLADLGAVGDLELHLARCALANRAPLRSHIDIGQFVEWVKERSHLTRGVTIGTMMRDEAFHFTRIGTFLERADSTARILTAHQSDLVPGADAGVVPDPFQWSVLLRALSAFEVYRRVYRDVITPVARGAAA